MLQLAFFAAVICLLAYAALGYIFGYQLRFRAVLVAVSVVGLVGVGTAVGLF
ncbi:MAG: hypothetical protein AAGL24_12660 [Pseudomonadota bacterium]